MQTKFKRHQLVRILRSPDSEYIEYAQDTEEDPDIQVKPGMLGKINVILPNGKYHVEILNEKKEIIAYAPFDEDSLEAED